MRPAESVRVICTAYGVGNFAGYEFREELVGNMHVGVAHIPRSDAKALRWFAGRPIFVVEGGVVAPEARNESPPPSLEDLTIAQLREFALENDIDLGEATKKADIIAAINGEAPAAEAPEETEETDETDESVDESVDETANEDAPEA